MGWQLINARISRTGEDGGDEQVESLGYLIGDGHEKDFFCFNKGPWHRYEPYISKEYSPHIEVDGTEFYIQDFTFNGKKVFATAATDEQPTSEYIFWSNAMSAWIYLPGGGLREPFYWTDIDEETVLGDAFYVGGQVLPDLNDQQGPEDWELTGNTTTSYSSKVYVSLKHDYWEWESNYSGGSNSKPCGRYRNPKTGSFKTVGIPTFKATNSTNRNAYYDGIEFQRAGKDSNDNWIYNSDSGKSIQCVPALGKWVLGTPYQGKWSESDSPPTAGGTPTLYQGFQVDEATHQPVRDGNGDFALSFDRYDMGKEKKPVLIGEVSLWRRTNQG